MQKPKHMRIGALLLVVCLLFAVGCKPKEQALVKLTLNEVTHSVFYAPFYAAIENGFFAEEGIAIDLVNGGGSDKSMTALLSGDAQIALLGPETAVYVYNGGNEDNAVIIGQLTRTDGSFLVGREPDDDFSWQKVKGKTIIGGRVGGMPNMVLEYVLKLNGLTPGVDVEVDTSVQFNLMAGAFEGSDAEYVTLFEPTASLCEGEGKGYILTAVGGAVEDIPFTAFMIRKSTLQKDKALYQSFMNAVAKGQKWVSDNDAETVATAIAPQFPDSDIPLLTKVVTNYKEIGAWNTTPVMNEDDFYRMQDVIIEAGELETRAPFDKIVDNSLANAVKPAS